MSFARFALVCLLTCLAACSDARQRTLNQLANTNTRELRKDAARLYLQFHSSRGPEFIALKKSLWPETFKKLNPVRIGCYKDGLALVFDGEAKAERGLHIVPLGMDLTPSAPSARYEKVEEGIYWYSLRK